MARLRRHSDPSPEPSMGRRLSLLIGDRRGLVVALAACSILSGLTEAATLAMLAQLAASVVGGAHRAAAHNPVLSLIDLHLSIGKQILIALGLSLARLFFQIPLSVLPARIAADVITRMRLELFDAFSRASWTVQSAGSEGTLQEVMTNQVSQAIGGVAGTTGVLSSSLQFAVLMISAFYLNVTAAVVVGAMTVVLFGFLRPMRTRGGRYAQALSSAQLSYARNIAESNRLAEESQVFGTGGALRKRIAGVVARSKHWYFRTQIFARLTTNIYQSLIYLLLVAGIWVLHLTGATHAGSLTGVLLLLLRAGMAGQLIQASYQGLVQSLPFVKRVQQTIEEYRENAVEEGREPAPAINTLSFQGVSFAYRPQTRVLSDIDFTVRAGEAIGVVGPSGAGKSTLVQLLLRLRPPTEGRYLINGLPAASIADGDWHRLVSYVPQEPRLLHASVAANIRFFRDLTDEQIERAARLAHIHDDILSWPGGYEATIGPRADAVSGGQQQRICLARALAAEPDVLVLDEPTSALDPQSESLISASLKAIHRDLTMFIVAHRMSTLESCDRVMVIVDGRVEAFDTRMALQRDNLYFRHASQLAAAGHAV
jgi:ABC-type multidrug transport system fused ATPase/permease subunit